MIIIIITNSTRRSLFVVRMEFPCVCVVVWRPEALVCRVLIPPGAWNGRRVSLLFYVHVPLGRPSPQGPNLISARAALLEERATW